MDLSAARRSSLELRDSRLQELDLSNATLAAHTQDQAVSVADALATEAGLVVVS